MKVYLPSSGILGTKSVELRQPTFGDIRNSSSFNSEEAIFKYEFIKQLLSDKFDFSKITKYDLEYLFTIVAFSVQFNSIGWSVKCDCGKTIKGSYTLEGKDIVVLEKYQLPHVLDVNGITLEYNILSASQSIQAAEYALSKEDFNSAYEDACAAFIFGKSLSDIDWVKSLDLSVYLSAFLFQQANFHGLKLEDNCVCPFCGASFPVSINVTSAFVKIDIPTMMKMFASVSSVLSFDAFINFTVSEYRSFIDAVNTSRK